LISADKPGAAVTVREDLHFHVTWPRQIFFDQHAIVAEAAGRFALARCQRRREILSAFDDPHTFTATTRARLQQDRIADRIGFAMQQLRILIVAVIARHERHGSRIHQRLRGRLRAHRGDRFDRRSDEDDAGRFAGMREVFVFRQEAIARMHRLCASGARGFDDAFDPQIAFRRGRSADVHRLVTGGHVFRVGVRIGIHGHARDAEPLAGRGDAACNLAAVGNQDLVEHEVSR
jgi:hypothetical protein